MHNLFSFIARVDPFLYRCKRGETRTCLAQMRWLLVIVLTVFFSLTACSGGGEGKKEPPQTAFNIGGVVNGFESELVLLLTHPTGEERLTVAASGNFSFGTPVESGNRYTVKIISMPTGQHCALASESGFVYQSDVSIQVDCLPRLETVGGLGSGVLNTGNTNVAIDGDFLYLVGQWGLQVQDIRNRSVPILVGQLPFEGIAGHDSLKWHIAVHGGFAYVSSDSRHAELQVIDIRDPTRPALLSNYATWNADPTGHGTVQGIAVNDNYALLTMGYGGLFVLNISDPHRPTLAGKFNTVGFLQQVVEHNGLAYISGFFDDQTRLLVVDIGNPFTPVLKGELSTPFRFSSFALSGNNVFLIAEDLLVIVDIGSSALPVEIGRLQLSENYYRIDSVENYVYLKDEQGGLVTIDVSTPDHPIQLSALPEAGYLLSPLVFSNDMAYAVSHLAFSNPELVAFDLSIPASPSVSSRTPLTPGTNGTDIVVQNGFVYFTDFHMGLKVLQEGAQNVSQVLGGYPLNVGENNRFDGTRAVAVSNSLAFLVGSYGLKILDVIQPNLPTQVGQLAELSDLSRISVDGHYAYFVARQIDPNNPINSVYSIRTADIGNPASPHLLPDTSIPGFDVKVRNGLAYVAGANGLRILDVSNPQTPLLVSETSETGPIRDIVLADNRVITLSQIGSSYLFYVVDISNPLHPQVLGYHKFPDGVRVQGFTATALRVFAGTVSLSTSDRALYDFDISNPRSIKPLSAATTNREFNAITLSERFIYAVEAGFGLRIFAQPEN